MGPRSEAPALIKPGTEAFVLDALEFPELLSPLLHRLRTFPGSGDQFVRMILARLVAGDPAVLALVVTNHNTLVGHAVVELVGQVAVIHQCFVDPGFPRSIDIFLRLADTWCMQKGASLYTMQVSQHEAQIWSGKYKRYGFQVTSYNVERWVR